MFFAVLNKSKRVTSVEALMMTRAVQRQLAQHAAPAWGRLSIGVAYYPSEDNIPEFAIRFYILDDPDVADAEGYHDEEKGVIYAKIFASPVLDNGGTALFNNGDVTVASVLSHEVVEAFVDPNCNAWVDGPLCDKGNCYALEACDPVQEDSYPITVGGKPVAVSNFVVPAYFDPQAPDSDQFDYLKRVTKPFSMSSGGYMIVRSKPGDESQIFGETAPAAWRMQVKKNPSARTYRRTVYARHIAEKGGAK